MSLPRWAARPSFAAVLLFLSVSVFSPGIAHAQWYAGLYAGVNHMLPAAVTIDQPAANRLVTFSGVRFAAQPFKSPQYYGWRAGRLFGSDQSIGVELEFIHMKAIGVTNVAYPISGTLGTSNPITRMSELVERYSMTHGLNFALINFVSRTAMANGRAHIWVRSGIGPTIPHAETTIAGEVREQYEFGGVGAQTGGGIDIRLSRYVSGIADYKFTFARPRIDVAGGTGRTTSKTHHFVFGFAFGLPQ